MSIKKHRPVFFPYEQCAAVESIGSPPRVFILSATTVEALRSIMQTSMWQTRWAKEMVGTTRQWSDTESADIKRWGETLKEELMMPIDFCTYVAMCIQDSIGTGNATDMALYQYITQNFPPNEQPPLSACNDNILAITGCDYDNLFAQCRQLVQLIHQLNVDLFEAIETAYNNLEAIGILADWVPVVGTVVEFAQWIVETWAEAYMTYYTVEIENDLSCKLFCKAAQSDDCTLTWEDVCTVFSTEIELALQNTILEYFTELLTLSLAGDAFVYAMFAMMANVLRHGSTFMRLSLADVQGMMAAISNDTDPDWESLCEDCTLWHATFDVTLACAYLTINVGHWVTGEGIYADPHNDGDKDSREFTFNYTFGSSGETFIATHVKFTFDTLSKGTWGGDQGLYGIMFNYDMSDVVCSYQNLAGPGSYEADRDDEITEVVAACACRVARGYTDGSARLTSFEIWGYGDPGAQFKSDATLFEYTG